MDTGQSRAVTVNEGTFSLTTRNLKRKPSNMTSARPVQRRALPSPLAPSIKQAISVEEWETKAGLEELEMKSVSVLKAASDKAPLPLKVCLSLWIFILVELLSSFK